MEDKSISFLKDKFAEYYRDNRLELPDRFERREFAFMSFGTMMMRRHLSFKKRKDFETFISKMVPSHAYYSSAFYQRPDANTMDKKGWMGAELIFDLDLDHLRGVEKVTYEEGLSLVKAEFKKLVEDFLMKDFGFDENNLKLYFSGGRGYHCHVVDPRVFQLDSGERREIVDYITGNDINVDIAFKSRVIENINIRGRSVPKTTRLEIAKPDEFGWRGRVSRGMVEILNAIVREDNSILKEYRISTKDATRLKKELSPERLKRIVEEGFIDQSGFIKRFLLKAVLKRGAILSMAGETDEPVTCDIKRLIRLPSSLHGKTGLKVCKIKLDMLEDFNPLEDAVVFDNDPVRIDLINNIKIRMKNEDFDLKKGKNRVPEYLAVLLVGRRIAKII